MDAKDKNAETQLKTHDLATHDELNAGNCPGETLAVMETLGLPKIELRKTPFDAYISYARIG